jgi:hypothetical protein
VAGRARGRGGTRAVVLQNNRTTSYQHAVGNRKREKGRRGGKGEGEGGGGGPARLPEWSSW